MLPKRDFTRVFLLLKGGPGLDNAIDPWKHWISADH